MVSNSNNGSGKTTCPFEKLFPSQLNRDDLYYMKLAYNEAIDAWRGDDVAVGAIVELNGEVIASDHNRVDSTNDPTAHAEILAINKASRHFGDWRLVDSNLYVTKEPCPIVRRRRHHVPDPASHLRDSRLQDGLSRRSHQS